MGMSVPRDVSRLDVYVDSKNIDPKQYGAVANRQPAGGNVTTGGTVRFSRRDFAYYRALVYHEFAHVVGACYHVRSERSIMNDSGGSSPDSLYTYADIAKDVKLATALRTAYRRVPGTGFVGDAESDREASVMSAAAEGGEETMCRWSLRV